MAHDSRTLAFFHPRSRRHLAQSGDRRNRSLAFHRKALVEALESRFLLSTVNFISGSETVNQSSGSFSIPVSLSSPPSGAPTVSNFTPGFDVSGGVAVDAAGNVYVANFDSNLVNKVTPGGEVSAFIPGGLLGPEGMTFGPNGNLYIAENFDGVDEVTPSGQVTDIANGSMFDDPRGIAIDASGNIYVANAGNGTVVKVTPGGAITTFASGFQNPQGLAINASGDLFVANASDSTGNDGSVQEVTPNGNTGKVSTFLSNLEGPTGVAVDAAGNVYVTNGINDPAFVNKVGPAGRALSTFVSGLHFPGYMAFDGAGNLYIASNLENNNVENPEVIKVTQTVAVPFALGGSAVSGVDYSGVTASPLVFGIGQTSLDITGNLRADAGPTQTLTFSLGTPSGGATLGSPVVNNMTINEPVVVQFGTASETVSESAGTFSIPVTVSGTPTEPASVPFSIGGSALAYSGVTTSPLTFGVGQTTVDITGTLLVDPGPSETLTLTLGTPTTGAVLGIASVNSLTITEPARVQFGTASETLSVSAGTFSIPVTVSGTPAVSTFASGFDRPFSLAVDASGNLYVPNGVDDTVSKVTPAGVVTTFASGFNGALGVAFDDSGNLYVTNGEDGTVSKVTSAGVVTPYASGFSAPRRPGLRPRRQSLRRQR